MSSEGRHGQGQEGHSEYRNQAKSGPLRSEPNIDRTAAITESVRVSKGHCGKETQTEKDRVTEGTVNLPAPPSMGGDMWCSSKH